MQQAGGSAGQEAARSAKAAQEARKRAENLERRARMFARGEAGEVAVARALDALAAEGYLRLDDRPWPGRKQANIDHVLLGPPGLFIIDAKNWTGRVEIRNGVLRQNGYNRMKNLESVRQAALTIMAMLPFASPRAEAVVVLAGESVGPMQSLGTVTIAGIDDIVEWIRAQPRLLAPDLVQQGYLALDRGLVRSYVPRNASPPAERAFDWQAISSQPSAPSLPGATLPTPRQEAAKAGLLSRLSRRPRT
ncbi:MAG TPA: nuclease-related domain-containing protein [Mycobacteriales bacterium]|nr:nuclease-related domain-containing protein [Mycobacteriales bacterium]